MAYSENDRPIKVMMLVASLPPDKVGGAELQALRLGKEFANQNIFPWFVTPGRKNNQGDGRLDNLPVSRPYSLLSFLFATLSGLKKKKTEAITRIEYDDKNEVTNKIISPVGWPTRLYMEIFYWNCLLFIRKKIKTVDLIHAHTMEWSAIVAVRLAKKFRKPVLIKDSTMNGFQSLSRFPHGDKIQETIRQHAHFIAMTRAIESNLEAAGIPGEKIFRIPNGISIQSASIRETEKGDQKNVLFVGNLYQQPAKGVDILLKSWRIVISKFPSAQLMVAGEGDLIKYGEYAEKLGIKRSVQFLGKRNDLVQLYATANLFVLPSRREGMSNALLEAMMNSLPCVATNISGSQDIIETGVNGLLVPPADVEALATAIIKMLKDESLAESMGRKGRETIQERFDIRSIAGKYRSVYNQMTHAQ